ncbi:MAG: flippase-like domain-containing protein [Bacteroidetes bacterium]|nr:flippase-like domain-containing protein [Bacteroidota bacterium]
MNKTITDVLKVIIFLGLGIFFIWLFMHNLTPEEKKDIFSSFKGANFGWIAVSVAIGILSHISRTIRWKILIEPMGYNPGTRNTFFAVMIGYFANMALPRLGEVTRCGILARYEKIPMQKSFGTVVTERGLDLILLIAAFVINFIINIDKLALFKESLIFVRFTQKFSQIENPGIIYWIAAAFSVLVLVLLIIFRYKISHTILYKKIKEIILGFFEGMKSLLKIRKPFWFIFHSFFIWLAYLIMTWVVFFSLPSTSQLGIDAGLAVLVFGSIGIIIIQGGIGIYPWIVAQILALFFIPGTKGYAMGWLLWSGQTAMIVLAGIISMILLPLINQKEYGARQ